ncbi:MAG: hypothetical protein ACJA13_002547, partial [Paraglaciecola sp.]
EALCKLTHKITKVTNNKGRIISTFDWEKSK